MLSRYRHFTKNQEAAMVKKAKAKKKSTKAKKSAKKAKK
jgi:hypothetical protein